MITAGLSEWAAIHELEEENKTLREALLQALIRLEIVEQDIDRLEQKAGVR